MNINRQNNCHLKIAQIVVFIISCLFIDIAVDGKADLFYLLLYLLHSLAGHLNLALPVIIHYLMALSDGAPGVTFNSLSVGILLIAYQPLTMVFDHPINTISNKPQAVNLSYQTSHQDVIKALENMP